VEQQKMPKTTIILNAPPMSGKDTIADLLVKQISAHKQMFKEALYKKTAEYFEYDLKLFKHYATNRKYKDNKRSAFSTSRGFTPREALIHVSEDVFKPKYGEDFFGKLAAERLLEGVNVFSDGGGWLPELQPIVDASDKTIICRLYRHGYSFDGDSRSYYSSNINNVIITDIHLEDNKPQAAVDAIIELSNYLR
jgi:hypothetical protein